MAYLDLKGLSTEAMIGKLLILVAFILKIVGVIVIFALAPAGTSFSFTFGLLPFAWVWTGVLTAWGLLGIAGIIVLCKALRKFKKDDLQRAAVFALIAAFLPPVGLELIGAVLLLISPEVKGKPVERKKKK